MPSTSRTNAKARTRAKLLRAASQVFATQGFNGATVEEIAERAGFTRGAFYANFSDKADALLTLLEEERGKDMDEVARLMSETPDDQKLAVLQSWYLALLGDQRLRRATAELIAQAAHVTAARARLAQRQAYVRSTIASLIKAYRVAEGLTLPLADDLIASFILAIGDGVAIQRQLEPDALADDTFTTAVAYLWFGLNADQV